MKIDLRKALATLTGREREAAGRGNDLTRDDSTLQRFLERRIAWHERRSGADKTNARYAEAKREAQEIARELWSADTELEYNKDYMIDLCLQHLRDKGLYEPGRKKLWDWLKEAEIVPDYVSRPGRRKS